MNAYPNDPAFPAPNMGEWDDPQTCNQWRDYTGMSLRAYFAGQAMQGLIFHNDYGVRSDEEIAEGAVRYADALIAELNKAQQ